MDFTRSFLPETFAQTQPLGFLSTAEKLKLNHIRARGYLALFEMVEAFVVPFISGQAEDDSAAEPFRTEALRHFVGEETKHRELFATVLREFDSQFGTPCGLIDPAEEICRVILGHAPLAVSIAILGFELMSQGIEEAQHAKLDGLLLKSLAQRSAPPAIESAIDEYFEIGTFLDGGFKQQAELDFQSLERAIDRQLTERERNRFLEVQHRALRWTFLGSTMVNRNFLAALASASDEAAARAAEAAKSFTLN